MKKTISLLMSAILLTALAPFAVAVDVGTGIGLDITTEEFAPLIWMCNDRAVLEDAVEEGRETVSSDALNERIGNYLFEGEQVSWTVLVMDKNKIEEIQDVVATIGSEQGMGNDIEVECGQVADPYAGAIPAECNARIDEEMLTDFDSNTQQYYECIFTVETPESMYGEYFLTVEAISIDGEATMDENEYWFLNPVIELDIDGTMTFDNVRPGTISYSDTLLITNAADDGSGVLLDMFISGTDFYDPASSGAKCPTTNHLKLSLDARSQASFDGNMYGTICDIDTWIVDPAQVGIDNHDHLCYYAVNGAYSTAANTNADSEGYAPIAYSDQFTTTFYDDAEIISNDLLAINGIAYDAGNVLAPGADIAITFKLGLPEPCVGDFSTGDIYFWGEAI